MTEHDAAQWYIARDGKQTGPMTDLEIKAIAAHRYFKSTDLVWRTGLAEWQPALTIFPPPAPVTPPRLPPMTPPTESGPPTRPPSPAQVAQVNAAAAPAAFAAPRAPQPSVEPSRLPVSPPFRDQPSIRDQTSRPGQPSQRADQSQPRVDPSPQRLEQPRNLAPRGQSQSDSNQHEPTAPRVPTASERPGNTTQPARRAMAPTSEAASSSPPPPKRSRAPVFALAATVLIVSGGIWTAANPGLLKGVMGGLPAARDVIASSTTAATAEPTTAASLDGANRGPDGANRGPDGVASDLDQRWQKTAHWQVIKREFPDWYGERLRETTKSASENKSETEITRSLVEQMIALRRQNASLALSASTPKLKVLANAFLNNLRLLKEQSTTACFNFISQGEATPGLLDQFSTAPGAPSAMQMQVAAIFDAIGDGRKTPVMHDKPLKGDYDTLMAQLAKLGWSQTDVATFADPKALARAEPARVCQMVQDWFTAHISIADDAVQERLLGETLRPVVSG